MNIIKSSLLCMLSACAVLGACNACSPAQNAALKASFPTDEKNAR